MIDIKNLSTNLVKEAVNSTVSKQIKEGRPATSTNLTADGKVGSNADQLFLKFIRALRRKENESDQLAINIYHLTQNMSDEEIIRDANDPNSELFKLIQEHEKIEKYTSSLETIMKKYCKEYMANGGEYNPETDSYEKGSVSEPTRAELRNFDRDELNRYDTDLYQKSLDKLKSVLNKKGMNRDSFFSPGLDPNDPKTARLLQMAQNLGWEGNKKPQDSALQTATEVSR